MLPVAVGPKTLEDVETTALPEPNISVDCPPVELLNPDPNGDVGVAPEDVAKTD